MTAVINEPDAAARTAKADLEHEDDFVAVQGNKKHVGSAKRLRGKGKPKIPAEKDLAALLQEKINLLERSAFLKTCLDMLKDNLTERTRMSCRICCFGLGSLRHSPKSLLQLALFRILETHKVFHFSDFPIVVDPEFGEEDVSFLKSLGYEVPHYTEGLLDAQDPVLMYMPHCPRWLYETLLDRNKSRHSNLILLSNDLSLYAERELRTTELEKIPNLRSIGGTFDTYTLPELEDRPDAFNDMAWQWIKQGATADPASSVEGLSNAVALLPTSEK